LEGGGAGAVYGVEGRAGWVADVVEGHAGSFATTEFGEDGSYGDILDGGGRDVGVLGKNCAEDLANSAELKVEGEREDRQLRASALGRHCGDRLCSLAL